jgi:hypothetical protein
VRTIENAWIELQHALEARASGLEGRARVCSRRAAGLAIKEFLIEKYNNYHSNSLFDLIVDQTIRDFLPPQLFDSLDRLSLKVNEQFQLPTGVDLISDAKLVITLLEAKLED